MRQTNTKANIFSIWRRTATNTTSTEQDEKANVISDVIRRKKCFLSSRLKSVYIYDSRKSVAFYYVAYYKEGLYQNGISQNT